MGNDETGAGEEGRQPKAGGNPWLLIIVSAVIALAIGAGGAFFVVASKRGPEGPSAAQVAEMEAQREAGGERFKERLYSLEPFVVNVTGDGYNRFLKVKIEIEADSPELKHELDARLSQVRDALIVLLSSKRLTDITDFEGKALLKEDILHRINDVLETGDAESVLFTEFVVQGAKRAAANRS